MRLKSVVTAAQRIFAVIQTLAAMRPNGGLRGGFSPFLDRAKTSVSLRRNEAVGLSSRNC